MIGFFFFSFLIHFFSLETWQYSANNETIIIDIPVITFKCVDVCVCVCVCVYLRKNQ
jgi:hypothetical protein